ncbi:GyrI-like domain-containing protein [uncultured Mucilaginibacter sp.]|uniref:GyrI-like domain-containing protein n=1 Tax=uncultured Mucilaginibacter sp. TaxID=797541 RepID=UPI0025EA0A02|nr:GyrI-like domain-containing protein [uncultured Mucilaginibacter sp.]
MELQIINQNYTLSLYGVSGTAVNRAFAETGMKLMGEMWKTIQAHKLKHKGINVWVYEANEHLFTGVELEDVPPPGIGLEPKQVNLKKYAYYKLVGPYSKIPAAYEEIRAAIKRQALDTCFPWLEVYGHWTPDESKLETEIFICLK